MRNRIKAAYARALLFIIRPALERSGYVEYSGTARLDTLEADMVEYRQFVERVREEFRFELERLDKQRASASEQAKQLDEKLTRNREEIPKQVLAAEREARSRGGKI